MSRLSVLIIEDDQDAADCLEDLISGFGHEVRVAHDGATGLISAESFPPDLVLLDLGLPGIDGREVVPLLRQSPARSSVVVALTGYSDSKLVQNPGEGGFDHYLIKPVSLAELKAVIDTTSSSKQESSPSSPTRSSHLDPPPLS